MLLGQDRVEAIFLEAMKKNGNAEDYEFSIHIADHLNSIDNLEVDRLLRPIKLEVDADVDQADSSMYPIHVTLEAVPAPAEIANGDITSGLYRSNLFVNGTSGAHESNGVNGHADPEEEFERQVVHCKYLVGCDGAHSWVRK